MKKYDYKIGDEVILANYNPKNNLLIPYLSVSKKHCEFERFAFRNEDKMMDFNQHAYLYFQRYKPTNWGSRLLPSHCQIDVKNIITEPQQKYKVKYVGLKEVISKDLIVPRLIIANKDVAYAIWGDGVKKVE